MEPKTSLINSSSRLESDEFSTEIYEWLSLVRLGSPRVAAGDKIDPYLSRYQVPGDPEEEQAVRLSKISWQGFLSSSWARQTLADLIIVLPSMAWFSMSMSTFPNSKGLAGEGQECTILRPPQSPGEFLMWEIRTHE